MKLVFRFVAAALIVGCATAASAQQGLGGLRGIITDAQGAVLPGVTVTVTSPTMLGPQVGVTNAQGEYRVLNLPPGTFTLTAELTGFATFERPGILSYYDADKNIQHIDKQRASILPDKERERLEVSELPFTKLTEDGLRFVEYPA